MIWGNKFYLADRMTGRNNNLNLLRFVAATSVLVSHSFPISYGPGTVEPLLEMTGNSLGGHAVVLFFILSGLLIAASFESSRSAWRFSLARVFRLFPGLLGVLLLTVFVLGPLATTMPLADYFGSGATWNYLVSNLRLFKIQYELPGVFAGNPYGAPINGSLWSLRFEVECYILLGLCGMLGLLHRAAFAWGLMVLAIAVHLVSRLPGLETSLQLLSGNQLAQLGSAFGLGSAAYILRDRIALDGRILAALITIAILFHGTPVFRAVLLFAIVYGALWTAYVPQGAILRFNRLGDYSYGIYLYAFPVQQLIAWQRPGLEWWHNAGLAMIGTACLAFLSWHLVEKRAQALGRRLADWRPAMLRSIAGSGSVS